MDEDFERCSRCGIIDSLDPGGLCGFCYDLTLQVSDVPTGSSPEGIAKQPSSAENQSLMLLQLNGLIDEITGAVNTTQIENTWLIYVRGRIEQIVKAVAVDTNEERTNGPRPAQYTGETT